MKIVITGATGFVGRQITEALLKLGHEVVALSRHPEKAKAQLPLPVTFFAWDSTREVPPTEALSNADAVIHLAGENVATRWTEKQKKAIYDSRVLGTRNLVAGLQKASVAKPLTFIAASAVGFYGDRGEEKLSEDSPPGQDFLAGVCRDWEAESGKLSLPASRTVIFRMGVVLGHGGGALEKLLPVFKSGMGGPVGSGSQWMSWIHLGDLVAMVLQALQSPSWSGTYHATAPQPTTNQEFSVALGHALHRPSAVKAPAFAIKLMLGEMAAAVLSSQRAYPTRALQEGFVFRFPEVSLAFQDLFTEKKSLQCETLIFKQWLNHPIERVFSFFSDEKNLEVITPPWLNFQVLKKSTPKMGEGTLVDYQLKIHGVPLKWQSRIEKWEPGRGFVDTQVKGPYSVWHHTHSFETLGKGTLMTDRVFYRLPAGLLGKLLAGRFVKKDVTKIFAYRQKIIGEKFPS